MHRAVLSDEAGAKLLENPVSLRKDPPKPIGIFEIIRAVSFILVEAGGVSNFVGFRVNLYVQVELSQLLHQARVESRYRLWVWISHLKVHGQRVPHLGLSAAIGVHRRLICSLALSVAIGGLIIDPLGELGALALNPGLKTRKPAPGRL